MRALSKVVPKGDSRSAFDVAMERLEPLVDDFPALQEATRALVAEWRIEDLGGQPAQWAVRNIADTASSRVLVARGGTGTTLTSFALTSISGSHWRFDEHGRFERIDEQGRPLERKPYRNLDVYCCADLPGTILCPLPAWNLYQNIDDAHNAFREASEALWAQDVAARRRIAESDVERRLLVPVHLNEPGRADEVTIDWIAWRTAGGLSQSGVAKRWKRIDPERYYSLGASVVSRREAKICQLLGLRKVQNPSGRPRRRDVR